MNKVLIELHIPAIGEHFDIFIPTDVEVRNLNEIIANGISEITNGKYIPSKCELLNLAEPFGLLNPNLTLSDYNIKNGMKLYLI